MEEEVLEIKEEDSGVIYTDGYFVTVFFSEANLSFILSKLFIITPSTS